MEVFFLGLHREQFLMGAAVVILSKRLCSVNNYIFRQPQKSVVAVWLLNLVFVAEVVNQKVTGHPP